jgi:PEP-CTERM motif-containing protein
MRAALVSATSLAALLAFEVGLDVAIDAQSARAQTFSVENPLNFGNVLLSTIANGTTVSMGETVTNGAVSATNTFTFPAVATSPFSGSQVTYSVKGSGNTTLHHYTFTPTSIGSYSTTATIKSGSSSLPFTLVGNAVAPRASITLNPYARIGGGAQTIAAITVSNSGDGDLSSGGSTNAAAQLKGSIGAISGSVFTRSGSTTTFSLNDSNYSGPGTASTTAAFNYVYTPTLRGPGGRGSLTIALTNGNSNGTNTPTVSTVTLTGTGVGPTYESKINGTTFSNSTNVGHNTIAAGTISAGTSKAGATATTTITVSNISTDPGAASLTDLTLESFALSGTNAADFGIVSFALSTIAENTSVTVTLDFSGPTVGNYNADLALTTDEGASLGAVGAVFNYVLAANVPEPATVLTFGVGLAGLGWARRRRAKRVASPVG